MKIFLNDREEEFPGSEITVSAMLEIRKFSFKMRIVKINGEFISKNRYDSALIKDGDKVQLIYLMSGG